MELNALRLERSGLRCPSCEGTRLEVQSGPKLVCASCMARYRVDEDVIRMDEPESGNAVKAFYEACGGAHFVGTTFESNPLIHITTRAYCKFLESAALIRDGALLDFGCGDGRLSLWAAENGFASVLAVDTNLASLKRLAAQARERRLDNLLVVCSDSKGAPLRHGFFETVLCFEVLYYLVPALGRQGAVKMPAAWLSPRGTMVVSEFSRFGRAMIDLDSMNLENARALAGSAMRWEKFADDRLATYLWSLEELEADFRSAGLAVVSKSGVSLAAALFQHAWTFTTYPLRPPLDGSVRELVEAISDATQGACESARNIVYALRPHC